MESGIESGFLAAVVQVSLVVLSLSVVVAFGRVLRGPSLPDRVVAIDFASYITMGFLGTYAILSGREAYIDAALVLGLLAFIGTIAMARYIEGRSGTKQHASSYQEGDYTASGGVGGGLAPRRTQQRGEQSPRRASAEEQAERQAERQTRETPG